MNKRIFTCRFIFLAFALALLTTLNASTAADPIHGSVSLVEVKYGNISTEMASVVEVSPDGKYLYLGSTWGSISVFKRDAGTGRVLLVQYIQGSDFGLPTGLFGLSDIVISPTGSHLYASTDSSSSAVLIFNRSATAGTLSFNGIVEDDVSGVYGLAGARSLAVTPDGSYIFVAGFADDAIVRFERNNTTGALSFIGAVEDGTGSVQYIGGIYDLAVSPDGRHLYAAADVDGAITSFGISSLTGDLSYVNHQTNINGARGVAVSPDGKNVYVTSSTYASLYIYNRIISSGAVSSSGWGVWTRDIILDGARDVTVSPDGRNIYVIAHLSNTVVIFSRDPADGVPGYIGNIEESKLSAGGLLGPWQLAISPDGNFIYVASNVGEAMAILYRDENTGSLKFIHTEESTPYLNGPVGVAVSPDGKNVYAASNEGHSLNVLSRDLVTGKLRVLETFLDGSDGVDGLASARAVAVSPDGEHVYVAGHGDDGIAIFSRNIMSGKLGYDDVVLNSDPGVSGLGGIQSLAVSPAGGYLYAVSTGDDALAVFSRNASTGALTFVKSFLDSNPAYDGLNDAYAVTVSADGSHVYVAGYTDDSVAHFEWLKPGGLTYRYVLKDGTAGGGDELNGANSLVLSPDGQNLYVASRIDDAITIFSVGSPYGTLVYSNRMKDGLAGVDTLHGARAITINPSGTYVYVASQLDDALTVFTRNPATGSLTYFTSIRDTDPGIDGLDTANGIAISPASNHIYVASYDDDAISVFAHSWGIYIPMVVRE